MNSFVAYYEGFKDISNEPETEEDAKFNSTLYRKMGFYSLLAGYGILIVKHRLMIR